MGCEGLLVVPASVVAREGDAAILTSLYWSALGRWSTELDSGYLTPTALCLKREVGDAHTTPSRDGWAGGASV